MPDSFLPYGRQSVSEEDISAVVDVLHSNHLTTGPAVDAFEAALCNVTEAPYVVACANGTAALHLTALALKLGPGDKVIVPAITFLATANGPRLTGADIIFADVDPQTGLMEAEHLEQAIAIAGGPVKAIYPVHLNGQCANLKDIRDVANSVGAAVIEDACHALGGEYDSSPIANCLHSDMAILSFHPVKTIACGEGGAVTTRNESLYERLCQLRSHGIERDSCHFQQREQAFDINGHPNPWYYEMNELGFNYRLSDIHAALGTSQLNRLEEFVTVRRKLVEVYRKALVKFSPTIDIVGPASNSSTAWHLMVVLIDFDNASIDRASTMRRLREKGIGSQVHYIPVPWQPYYRKNSPAHDFPGAEAYYERCLSLPLYPAMSEDDVRRVVETLGNILLGKG